MRFLTSWDRLTQSPHHTMHDLRDMHNVPCSAAGYGQATCKDVNGFAARHRGVPSATIPVEIFEYLHIVLHTFPESTMEVIIYKLLTGRRTGLKIPGP